MSPFSSLSSFIIPIDPHHLVFHHDGPFDACAPSRNRQRNKAPMFAWSVRPDDPIPHSESAYPSPHAYKAFSNNYVDPPKKKVDAIAEAWGIHEPEPYEEFFTVGGSGRADGDTPASSIYNGRDSHNSHSTSRSINPPQRTKNGREPRDVYKEYLEEGPQPNVNATRPRIAARRSLVPPPQPIFVPHPSEVPDVSLTPRITSPGLPKRSKSLMQRIRKMRDSPNVPVSADNDEPVSPTEHSYPGNAPRSTRPTHRPQNSFLGRFGGGTRGNPMSEKPEPFVYIDAQNNKELPATPDAAEESSVEQAPTDAYLDGAGRSASPGLGRKTSMLRKVGRVVRNRP
jgi:Pal1 cell morphology protein